MTSSKGSRLISRVLPMAVKFWLQTQLDEIGDLKFEIQASDRQVLSGRVPGISLLAQQACYQGVRISHVDVHASDIEINIGQVLRGKSLRLKHTFPIEGQVVIAGSDLSASSTESILAEGLLDFWQTLLANPAVAAEVSHHYGSAALQAPYQSGLEIRETELVLHLMRQGQANISLKSAVQVEQGHILQLTTACWCLPAGEQVKSETLSGFCWNLGEQTEVRSLTIENDRLTCECKIMVQP
ncbi:MAG: DUF2993 domain-containing protein [Leptolyngbyaceae cyanobacterium]